MNMEIKNSIKNTFKLHGFMLEPKAIEYITDMLINVNPIDLNKVLDKIMSAILDQQLTNSKISVEIIEKAVSFCRKESSSLKLFQVIDAFQTPKLKFYTSSKKFDVVNADTPHFIRLTSDISKEKSDILKSRYEIIYERLKRTNLLNFKDTLKPIEYILSCGVTLKKVVVLGMLSQYQENQWFLEDSTGIIKINLENTKYHKGLILEGSFVLAEGRYDDNLLQVETLGMPPIELASMSRQAIEKNTNYFGGLPANESVKTCSQMEKIANTEISGKSLVFVSEVWLDRPIVMQKLKIMFHGYTLSKPEAFIFCGDFLSPDNYGLSGSEKLEILKQSIKNVIKNFALFPELALNSHLVFIPGPNDPFQGPQSVLPHPSLPESILMENMFDSFPGLTPSNCAELKTRVILASNPCRITYYNKELVVFREKIAHKFYRHCMYVPTENDQPDQVISALDQSIGNSVNDTVLENSMVDPNSQDVANQYFLESHLAWTILSQAHLMPLPVHVSPVFWGFDHALQLFPLPDLLVLSDPAATSFDVQISGCSVLNPPSFSSGENFPFKIYYPFKGELQSCNLDI